jgi:tryptophan synthase beta chain
LIGVEAGGRGEAWANTRRASRRFAGRAAGNVLLRAAGQAGGRSQPRIPSPLDLDYPSIGPEHAMLHDHGPRRIRFGVRSRSAGCNHAAARTEGIIPALESAHAVAEVIKRAPKMKKSDIVIVNISGRGDKDIGILAGEPEAGLG